MAQKNKNKQKQPKHHTGKSKVACNLRRKKIIKAIAKGKTQQEAGIEAGLNPNNAQSQVSRILMEPHVNETFKSLLDKVIPDGRLSTKYSDLLDAKKVISANVISSTGEGMAEAHSMTKDFIEVEDCAVQLKAADSISKLKGYVKEKHELINSSVRPEYDPETVALAEELLDKWYARQGYKRNNN